MSNDKAGYIYILTNPSFSEWVKIGYADDVEERVAQLNRSEATPLAFRIFATYKVGARLTDIAVHNLIDKLNPNLRSKDIVNDKVRVREFYAMSPDDAYEILEMIAKVNNLEANLKKYKPTSEQVKDEKTAEKIKELSANRHHFRDISFFSSLTGKEYFGTTGKDGTLCVIDVTTGQEIPNNSKPSKKAIIGQAIIDLGGTTPKDESLYQRYHKLMKLVEGKE